MNGTNACVVMVRATLTSRTEVEVRGGAELLYVSKKKKLKREMERRVCFSPKVGQLQ